MIARFEDNTGRFPCHGHILEYEDHETMRHFQTISCGEGDLEPTEGCDDGNTIPGDGLLGGMRDRRTACPSMARRRGR